MIEINLKIDTNELRSIYFERGDQKYFFGPKTMKQSLYLTISVLLYPFFAWYAINLEGDWMFIVGTILFSLFLYDFLRAAKPIIIWKKGVEAFIARVGNTSVLKVKYDEEIFWHIQDEVEFKIAWTSIDNAVVNPRLVWLFTDRANFLLPAKCMEEYEFQELSKMVFEKVQNVEKIIR